MSTISNSLLNQLLDQLTYKQTFTLCVHDVSGIIHNTPELSLTSMYTVHCSAFCSMAKLNYKGYQQCLRCKKLTLQKAEQIQTPFVGQCYLGVTEIVYPVYVNGQLQCILYLGNLYNSSLHENFRRCILRNAPHIGLNPKELLSLTRTLHTYQADDLISYIDTLSFIHQFIQFTYKQHPTVCHRTLATPIYRGTMHPAIRQASDYISVHYQDIITLESLSDMCYLHPDYFSKLFKKETGISVSHYIQSIRIERAKELLYHTNEKIIDVSLAVGFNNLSYFCRQFKHLTGLSPSHYRLQHQE